MNTVIAEFCHRVERIQFHGMGLSADAYQPDFAEVMTRLAAAGCAPDFAEMFRAGTPMLAALRRQYPDLPMPYHAEGLWLTQPRWLEAGLPVDFLLAAEQLRTLGSAWINHECASKLVGGMPFGTYLPPLFTEASARVIARQVGRAQLELDRLVGGAQDSGPLLLIELPPLTYFKVGPMPVPAFFSRIAAETPCGLVLDIGHLWTHYRYSRRSPAHRLEEYVADFLEAFPVERVVEIHVAGLAAHPWSPPSDESGEPLWLDAHGAPIPPVLFDMLDQVLAHPKLCALRGVALEVDTKDPAVLVNEFCGFRRRFESAVRAAGAAAPDRAAVAASPPLPAQVPAEDLAALEAAYRSYADLASGRAREVGGALPEEGSLTHYRDQYFPYEIVHWGGDLLEMFPETCASLRRADINLREFVRFWTARSGPIPVPFDFFLLKLERFMAFVHQCLPEAVPTVERERRALEAAYALANEPGGQAQEVTA